MMSEASVGSIAVYVPATPARALSPNARVNRWERHRIGIAYRDMAFYAAKETLRRKPVTLTAPLEVIIGIEWEKGHKRMDQDNALASCKYLLDGIALAVGIDDKHFHIRDVLQSPDPAGTGQVIVWLAGGAGERA